MSAPRKLAAILAADVAGYSRLTGIDEEGTLKRLRKLRRELINPAVSLHRGRIVKTTGDGILIEFPSVVDAVRCALDVQREMDSRNSDSSAEQRIEFRVGINLGDVVIEGEDLLGDGVNVAARLEGISEPGGICISDAAYHQVRDKLDANFEDAGEQQLKNIARPVRIYRLRSDRSFAQSKPALPLPEKPSIAVLPFTNMSGDPDQDYFADGVVEEIITALSRFRHLFVIARNSTFTYKGRAVDVREVGRELGVRYVLEGSVRRATKRVRITGQLIDATTGAHLWADRFDGGIEDIFDLQDQVTESVVGAITPRLEQAEIERARRKPTENLDAYDCYLRAVANYYPATPDEAAAMLRLLERAIDLDPEFAAAYGMAAWCHARRKGFGWIADQKEETAETARLARKAVELSKDNALPLAWAAFALALVVGELDEATVVVDRALGLNRNLAIGWATSGWLRVWGGEPDVAIEHLALAMRLSPLGPMMGEAQSAKAHAHFFAGRHEEACLWAGRTTVESPHVPGGLRILAASNALAGHSERARAAVARLLQVDPTRRVTTLRDVLGPYRRAQDVAKYQEGLRKAGLPEN